MSGEMGKGTWFENLLCDFFPRKKYEIQHFNNSHKKADWIPRINTKFRDIFLS